jgi:cytochrome c oxidase cbb3-type subunit IV
MLENVTHSIGGVGIYGILSICIFFAFFAGMILWAAGLKKSYLNSMCELPLESDATPGTVTDPKSRESHE